MARVEMEIAGQPECWRRAVALAEQAPVADALPARGERVAVVGCGTSWFVAQAYAVLREESGCGETDAFPASEFPLGRRYDRVLALTRSGTTTEVLHLLAGVSGGTATTVITSDANTPALAAARHAVTLPFASEESVVQTRFATSTLALLRAHLGENLDAAVADAGRAVAMPLPADPGAVEQISFLGTGWSVGLANEAALKCREAALLWAESYPAMEYRHGPISIAAPGRVVWVLGPVPVGLADQVGRTGATLVAGRLDPMAELIVAQRFAVAVAAGRGLDPDRPRHLTRSVILS
jgi:fructoselysine-6-P-deglycase FrlB-like protein